MAVYQCGVCGATCSGPRKRKTCGEKCAQVAVRKGQLSGGAAGAAKAKAGRADPYIESGVYFVPLTQGAYTKIDIQDAEKVMRLHWYLFRDPRTGRMYAVREENGVSVRLHRWLLNADETKDVDHENGDGLDNRRKNLREATKEQNARNARKRVAGTSKYKGVTRDTGQRTGLIWRARIRVDGKLIHLGRFDTEEHAAQAYDEAARRLHVEFACVNFPVSGEQPALGLVRVAKQP